MGTFGLPFALEGWGIGPTMTVAAVITAAGFVLSLVLAEETRGMSLAQAGGQETDDAAAPAPAAAPARAIPAPAAD